MKLAPPPAQYDQNYEIERNREIELTDSDNQKRNTDIILTSANGSRFKLTIDNSGNLSTTSV
tara:strand:+ start:37 stop:222 length:186 start_codon:yes stop_codon:yes gene_type:complete